MKKYLITGCAGFIGSNFVHYMLKKYPEILLVNLDKLTYAGNLENLKDVEGDPAMYSYRATSATRSWWRACLQSTISIMSSTLPLRAMWTAPSRTPRSLSRATSWAP